MYKKIIYILFISFFVTSCTNTMDSVQRGLTGEKRAGTDEFFIQKKDPLILPPDYESLPSPDERAVAMEEVSSIEKTLGASIEDDLSTSNISGAVEESILKKIQSK